MDHSPSLPEKPWSTCQPCWDLCFTQPGYRDLCLSPSGGSFSYTVTKSSWLHTFEVGCAWCSLLFEVFGKDDDQLPDAVNITLMRMSAETGGIDEMHVSIAPSSSSDGRNLSVDVLELNAEASDVAAKVIRSRPARTDVASEFAFGDLRAWMSDCRGHEACRRDKNSPLPTRMIDVGEDRASPNICLVDTSGNAGDYVALSYCWGTAQKTTGMQQGVTPQQGLTTSLNLAKRRISFSLEELSQTIKDAIFVTRGIGLRYLWVDAICIIQDDPEDKTIQMQSMASIYRNATVTVIAANAANAVDGCLRVQQDFRYPFPFWGSTTALGCAWGRVMILNLDGHEPINLRAWTFQERLLSPRRIIYGSHALQYECQTSTLDFGGKINFAQGSSLGDLHVLQPGPSNTGSRALTRTWARIVTDYSDRKLTVFTDRLPALSGLATIFSKLVQSEYAAGLWAGDLLPCLLLWDTSPRGGVESSERVGNPSWSWVTWPGRVTAYFPTEAHAAEPYQFQVIEATTTLKDVRLPFGEVFAGNLVVRGCSRKARLSISGKDGELVWEARAGKADEKEGIQSGEVMKLNTLGGSRRIRFAGPDRAVRVAADGSIEDGSNDLTFLAVVLETHLEAPTIGRQIRGLMLTPSVNGYVRWGTFQYKVPDGGGGIFEECPQSELTII